MSNTNSRHDLDDEDDDDLERAMCVQSTPTSNSSSRYNAGEILVQMRLVDLSKGQMCMPDRVCALALTAPRMDFASFVQEEHLPSLDLQGFYDDIMDIKIKIYNDVIVSGLTYIMNLVFWRVPLLSALVITAVVSQSIISAFVLAGIIHHRWTFLGSCLRNSIFALMTALSYSEEFRHKMTTGGQNAPLNKDGYGIVLRTGQSGELCNFLRRVVEGQQGMVMSNQGLLMFATRCICRLAPRGNIECELDEVIDALRLTDFIDLPPQPKLDKGDLVRVNGRRGTVDEVDDRSLSASKVRVIYDDDEAGSEVDEVNIMLIERRARIPKMPRRFVPRSIQNFMRAANLRADLVNRTIIPVLDFFQGVLVWKRPRFTFIIFLYLAGRSLLSLLAFMNLSKGRIVTRIAEGIEDSLLFCDSVYPGLVVILIFLFNSVSFNVAMTILRAWQASCKRRHAPSMWPFFRLDLNASQSSSQPLIHSI